MSDVFVFSFVVSGFITFAKYILLKSSYDMVVFTASSFSVHDDGINDP